MYYNFLYVCIVILKHTTMKKFDIIPDLKISPKFEEMRTFLSNVSNIGQGGCGVSALAMYRWMVVNDFPAKYMCFIMGYNRSASFFNNSEAQIRNETLPNACTHVGIIIQTEKNDMIIDCEKRWYFKTFNNTQIVSENELVSSLENLDEWNPSFSRGENIPIIEKELKIDLSDIKK